MIKSHQNDNATLILLIKLLTQHDGRRLKNGPVVKPVLFLNFHSDTPIILTSFLLGNRKPYSNS